MSVTNEYYDAFMIDAMRMYRKFVCAFPQKKVDFTSKVLLFSPKLLPDMTIDLISLVMKLKKISKITVCTN